MNRPDRTVTSPARPIAVLGTPMTLGLARRDPEQVPGVAGLAPALRQAGIVAALAARDLGDVPAPTEYVDELDSQNGIRNLDSVARHTRTLAAALEVPLAAGDFPLLLGGDCSVLLGALLALRHRGRYGLLHLDGHTDFYPPAHSASGQVAAMELWLATGGAPAEELDLDVPPPLLPPLDAVLAGYRDHDERRRSGAPDPADHLLRAAPFETIRREGARKTGEELATALAGRSLDGVWIHLDADVLDDAVMPAVDTREPGGLSHAEVVSLIRAVVERRLAVGLSVTIYDPTLDPTRSMARDLVATLSTALEALRIGSPA